MFYRFKIKIDIQSSALIVCIFALMFIIGCATPQPEAIPAFRQGVVTANQQAITAFSDINRMLREQQLDRAAKQPALNEELFVEGIPADARATWMRAFRLMDDYAKKLEQLLAPEQREGFEDELRKLGERLSAAQEEPLPKGVAGGFVKLGGLILQIKVGQDALEIMREVDPAIQDIFATMADAIGSSNAEGIRLTVWSSWTTQLSRLQLDFLKAGNVSARRSVAKKYLDMLGERDINDQMLGSLRISFLSLGSTHAAMARGNRLSAAGFIAIVQDEYKGLRAELERLEKKREEP